MEKKGERIVKASFAKEVIRSRLSENMAEK
jgi:hypothetical protein